MSRKHNFDKFLVSGRLGSLKKICVCEACNKIGNIWYGKWHLVAPLYIVVGCGVLVLREEHSLEMKNWAKLQMEALQSEGLSDSFPYSNITGLNQRNYDGMDMQFAWVKQEKCK